ncbi:MAG: hypothetical protein ACTSUG_13270 [Candidatus Helarchaeota archaeon]
MIFENFHLALLLIFVFFIIFLFIIGIRAKRFKNNKGFINTIFIAIILIASIILYYIKSFQIGYLILVYPLDFLLVILFLLMIGVQQIYIYRVKHSNNSEKNSELILRNSKDFTIHQESGRKALHLLGFLLIPPYFGFGTLYYDLLRILLDFFNVPPMNVRPELIPQTMALLGILSAFIFVMIPEIYRMYRHDYCLLQRFMQILRREELNAIGPHISTIGGVIIPIILISDPYLAVGTMFSAIMADGVASVIGKKWGKKVFNKKNNKTIEGLTAGIITCFFTSYIFYMFNYPVYKGIIFSLICCVIFGVLDYLSISISDNSLNPLISGIIISFTNILMI